MELKLEAQKLDGRKGCKDCEELDCLMLLTRKFRSVNGVFILGINKDNFSDAFDLDRLLVLVRRIRNNLFHGGKFPEGPEDDASRDRELLKSDIAVLQACLESDPQLMTSFLQGLI